RAGSTVLVKTLDTHPEIFCAGELFYFGGKIFHPESQYSFWKIPFLNKKLNYVVNYPKILLTLPGFMNQFYANTDVAIKAKGFKLMHFQTLYTPGILSYLEKNNVKVMVLIRKNVLRNTLSDLRARETGVYHKEQAKNGHIPKFKVNIERLSKKMKEIENFNNQLLAATENMNCKIVHHEDPRNWDAYISDMLQFLEVTDIKLPAATEKLNPDKLEDMIENYDELYAWLQQSGIAQYADE
ncbi:MAG TPA: hypothetical protein PL045_13765, partial [Chitinophagaceae bacterium]|nr:hypothetical protein [Chitinophagaceae bacterium]